MIWHDIMPTKVLIEPTTNPFFRKLKFPNWIKYHWCGTSVFFLVGHNWILNCGNWESIGEQNGETMGSTPYYPLLIKIDCNLEVFLLGSHLTSSIFICIKILPWRFSLNMKGKPRNPVFVAIFHRDFNKGANQIWNRVFLIIRARVFIGKLGAP